MKYPCGCTATGSERCLLHRPWLCHQRNADHAEPVEMVLCPPCKREKWASVNFDGRATPTRGKR